MTRLNLITWGLLILLTIAAGLVSGASIPFLVPIIMLFAALKFLGVAFGFMEMRKANLFWKVLILGYLMIICGLILLFL